MTSLPDLTPRLHALVLRMQKQKVVCDVCHGSGSLMAFLTPEGDKEYDFCLSCRGTGTVPNPQWEPLLRVLTVRCDRCSDTGWINFRGGLNPCWCSKLGFVFNPVWQQLRAQGIDGALEGALVVAVAAGGKHLLTVEADGPSFVARIWPNGSGEELLVEMWSDGGLGEYWPDEPPVGSPLPSADDAAVSALEEMMEVQHRMRMPR